MAASCGAAAGCPPRVTGVRPVPVAAPDDLTIATQNLWQLLDDRDDDAGAVEVVATADYRRHLAKLALQVADVLREPDVLAVQEAENTRVLAALAEAVAARTGHPPYQVMLWPRPDLHGNHTGFLVKAGWKVLALQALLTRRRLDYSPLFDRPPLALRVQVPGGRELLVVNVHLKSLHGSDDPDEAARIARRRARQADALAQWLRDFRVRQPGAALVLLGDFNATVDGLGDVDVLGPLTASGLVLLDERLPAAERFTYVHACRPEALDHVLVSPGLAPDVRALAVSRGNAGAPFRAAARPDTALRSSDHDGLVLYLRP
jgi:endonuclease/exonuclease/phosphatase family metal-dependent hydrolase